MPTTAESDRTDELAMAEAASKAKRHAMLRDLFRTAIAAFSCLLASKGMVLSAQSQEWLWMAAYAFLACFWAAGMWYWKELDG